MGKTLIHIFVKKIDTLMNFKIPLMSVVLSTLHTKSMVSQKHISIILQDLYYTNITVSKQTNHKTFESELNLT